MEKPPNREQYENLLTKQGEERANLRNEAHEEALVMDQEIGEHEQKIEELKGTSEAQAEKPASQEKRKYKVIELPEMAGKTYWDVYEHLKKTYGEDKLAQIPDDLNTLPNEFKDGNLYYFFGSITGGAGFGAEAIGVLVASWNYSGNNEWDQGDQDMRNKWKQQARVLLKD